MGKRPKSLERRKEGTQRWVRVLALIAVGTLHHENRGKGAEHRCRVGVQHRGAAVTGGHGNVSAVKCEARASAKRVWA